jgi:hypothetical protein
LHEISLAFVTVKSDIDQVTKDLISSHPLYLGEKIVNPGQVRRLIERLVGKLREQQAEGGNKENVPENLKISPKKRPAVQNVVELKPQVLNLNSGLKILETSPLVDEHKALTKVSIMDTSPPPLRGEQQPPTAVMPQLSEIKHIAITTPGNHDLSHMLDESNNSSIGQHLLMSAGGLS